MIKALNLTPAEKQRAARLHAPAITIDGCVQIHRDGDFWTMEPGELTALVVTVAHPLDRFYRAMQAMTEWYEFSREFPERILLAASSRDIIRAKEEKKTAIVMCFQGPKPIEDDLSNLELFHKLGLRVMQIAYNGRSYLADGSTEPGNAGLSAFGRLAIQEMNRLGILIDLSHVGERSSIEAAELSSLPVVCSHSNPKAVTDNPRNISDAEIKAIAEKGGTVGACWWGPLCWRDRSHGRPTTEDFFAHVDYLMELVGPDHISIATDITDGTRLIQGGWPKDWYSQRYPAVSSDYDRLVESQLDTPSRYAIGLDHLTAWPNMTRGLVKRGYSDEDILKILGGNMLRVYAQVWDR